MNKLSKIFLVIIILLIIALTTVTMLYINMRENAKKNLTEFLNTAEKLYEANTKIDELEKEWSKNAIIYHKEGNSIGSKNIKRKKSELSEYYSNLSCLIYNKKFYPKLYKTIAGIRYILKYMKFLVSREYELLRVMNRAYMDFFERK